MDMFDCLVIPQLPSSASSLGLVNTKLQDNTKLQQFLCSDVGFFFSSFLEFTLHLSTKCGSVQMVHLILPKPLFG